MAIKIGVINQKGGVGKTTTSVCMSDALSRIGYKVLLVDFDTQGNASTIFNVKDNEKTISDAIYDKINMVDAIVPGNDMGDIIPANGSLKEAANSLLERRGGELILRKLLSQVDDMYDIIIVDAGPKDDITMDNVLCAVEGVVIPMKAAKLAVDGLSEMVNSIDDIKTTFNPVLELYGVLLTDYDEKEAIQKRIRSQLDELKAYNINVFDTIIRHSAAIPNIQAFMTYTNPQTVAEKMIANSKGSIFTYNANNNGAEDYLSFTKELLGMIAE